LTFLTDEEAKKARMPQRLLREMFIKPDDVDDAIVEADVVESARDRAKDCGCAGVLDAGCDGEATATAAAAAAASCSLEVLRSARRRRELSGLRRRGSRFIFGS